MPPAGKRPSSATLDGWVTKRPRSSASPTSPPAAEDETEPPLVIAAGPRPLAAHECAAAAASPADYSEPSEQLQLAGTVYALAGFDDAELKDLTNELETHGATVLPSLDVSRCTHLLVDDGAPDDAQPLAAAASAAQDIARVNGLTVMTYAALQTVLGVEHFPAVPVVAAATIPVPKLPKLPVPPVLPVPAPRPAVEDGDTDVEDAEPPDFPTAKPDATAASAAAGGAQSVLLPPLPPEAELPPWYVDAWDREHVRLPCSPRCLSRQGAGGPLWHVLCSRLSPPPSSTLKLLGALRAMQKAVGGRWTFEALHEFLEHECSADERHRFFDATLPHMCRLALALPRLCPHPLPLLLKGRAERVSLHPDQCAALLAHAFFCSMPFRADQGGRRAHGAGGGAPCRAGRGPDLPYFDCGPLFGPLEPPRAPHSKMNATQPQKLRCLLGYFERLAARAESSAAAGRPWTPPPPPPMPPMPPPSVETAYALAGSVFALAGFSTEEHEDMANELRLHGALTVGRVEMNGCTHLLCEPEPPDDEDEDPTRAAEWHEAQSAVAYMRGAVSVVSWSEVMEWIRAVAAPAAPAAAAASSSVAPSPRLITPRLITPRLITPRLISFERLVLDTSETHLESFWRGAVNVPLCPVHARADGTIEDADRSHLQLDFANRSIGGGVLRNG